jgi:membrane protease YdiL (CAAX protease family)
VLVATLTKEIQLPSDQLILLNALALCLLVGGIFIYRKIIRRVDVRGGLVRTDLFALPDLLVVGTLIFLLGLLLAMEWLLPHTPKPAVDPSAPAQSVTGMQIIYGALQFALPVAAILALLIGRGVSLPELFGLKRVGLVRALATAAGLLLLLLPVFMVVTSVVYSLLGGHAEQQEMVKIYQNAAKTGKREIIWQVIIAAVVIAPVTEEILFRGYFYPVLKRFGGALPAAFGTAILFGAIHNNALGMPGLTLLALALTLAYEWSGSLLVSIFMHAWFNATTLFVMWWAIEHGMMK